MNVKVVIKPLRKVTTLDGFDPKSKFDNGQYIDNIFIVWNWCKPCGETKAKQAFGYINN